MEQLLIKILPLIAAVLVFTLIIVMYLNYQPDKLVKEYERINMRLKAQRNYFFNYQKIDEYLKANGATFHYGKWIEPIKYYALCLVLAVVLFSIGIKYHWLMAILGGVVGYQLTAILLYLMNKSDNQAMLLQIQTVYNTMIVQIKAGVYVTDSLSECYSSLPPGRLRSALEEVAGELFMSSSFDTAICNFNSKFNNSYIDSLCIILLQGKETGKTVELLNDMTEQLSDLYRSILAKKKQSLSLTLLFCMLGLLFAFFIFIFYALIMDVFTKAGTL